MFETTEIDSITILKMQHGKVNAMDVEFANGLRQELKRIERSNSGAVVLTSATRVFSAGVDLRRFIDEDDAYVDPFIESLDACFKSLFQFPKPLVAAINGHAVAGGCVMASACDYRMLAPRTRIGVPEMRVGVAFPPVALETMRLVAAPQAFQTMINVGATFRDDEAVRVGLADELVSSDVLLDTAIATAKKLMAIPSEVFSITKQNVRLPAMRNIAEADAQLGAQIAALWKSEKIREVIAEYVDKKL
jgi:enoyl-CoA hydratase